MFPRPAKIAEWGETVILEDDVILTYAYDPILCKLFEKAAETKKFKLIIVYHIYHFE